LVKATYSKKPVKINSITPEFTDDKMTNYGGLIPLSDFLLKKLDFREALASELDLGMGPNCSYQDFQVFALIIFGYLCGYKRLAHFEELSKDASVQTLLGLKGPINQNTLARRVKRASYKQSVEFSRVSQTLAGRVHTRYESSPQQALVLDFDSSVKGVYGNQQGAAKGFNPSKKGQKSYHPLMAFEASTKELIHSWWRTGQAYTSNGAEAFLAETCQRLPDREAGYVFRADSGFFGDAFLSATEAEGHDYLVKVKLKNLRELLSRQDWQDVPGQPGTAYCQFDHQCQSWQQPRTFVGIRTLTYTLREGVLFPLPVYSYACYVTSLQEAPLQIHAMYKDRGECENWIEALKNQMGAGGTLVDDFWANDLLWQLGVLAYNLSIWLRWLTDPVSWRAEPRTFREWFIHIAGKLTWHSRKYTLRMQSTYHYRPQWEAIYQQVCCLQL